MEGGPAAMREAVLRAVDEVDGLVVDEDERGHQLVAVYCDRDDHWRRLEHLAADEQRRTLAIIPELQLMAYARALAAGADGVVHAEMSSSIIASVARAVTLGETILPTFVAQALAAIVGDREIPDHVTGYERTLLGELRAGSTIRDIAERHGYAERSVRRHLQSLYLKIGATSRAEAIRYASTHDLDERCR